VEVFGGEKKPRGLFEVTEKKLIAGITGALLSAASGSDGRCRSREGELLVRGGVGKRGPASGGEGIRKAV